jgi:hypothetical protein
MKNKYSIFSLLKNSLSYHENWQRAWRDPEPKAQYDAVIVGGGGHGLATAFYLAKEHNLKNIAVVEKGWIGGGNTGRNTTIIRSNLFLRQLYFLNCVLLLNKMLLLIHGLRHQQLQHHTELLVQDLSKLSANFHGSLANF